MIEPKSRAAALPSLLAVLCGALCAGLAPAVSGCRACGSSPSEDRKASDGAPAAPGAGGETPLRGGTKQNLRSVWGSSDKDVWIVGDQGTILHYDGRAWAATKPVTLENLTAVRGIAQNQVWACGDKGTVFHFDGAAWARVAQAEKMTLLSIWASSPTDVYAVGLDSEGDAGYVYRFTGEKWAGQGVPGTTAVWDVFGTGPTDVWMVGAGPAGGVVLRGDGKKFDVAGYKGSGARSVWSPHPGDTWVAPYDGTIEHFSGSAWSHIAPVPGAGSLLRIAGSAPDDVWAVGLNGTILRNRGGSWAKIDSGSTEVLWSVWSRTVDDAWVVGNAGTILRWNGSSWTKG